MIPVKDRGRAVLHWITSALKWSVYSNLYGAISGHVAMTAAMMVLLRVPMNPALLLIAFSGSMLVYSLNRHMDRLEDQVSLPERSEFSRRYGWYFIAASIPLFGFSLILAALQSLAVLVVVLMPLTIGVAYSYFRIKRIFFLKNLVVSLAMSATLLIVVAAYLPPPITWLPLFGILVMGLLVNTIIFDIKDITGDAFTGIRTLPVTLGVRKTQGLCFILLAIMILLSILLIRIDSIFWALMPFSFYIGWYIASVPAGDAPWWYYGLVVDGEYIALLGFSFLFQ